MARRLILDTGVLINAERGKLDLHGLIGHDDPAIAAVTATEILTGVQYAAPEHRDMHALHAESLLAVFPAEPYDVNVARMHALLLARTRRDGRPRGNFDLMIAATAAA